jgi:hypothetical protein
MFFVCFRRDIDAMSCKRMKTAVVFSIANGFFTGMSRIAYQLMETKSSS